MGSEGGGGGGGGGLAVSVWTTTPWTLPANLAVAVSETIDYSVVEHASLGDRCGQNDRSVYYRTAAGVESVREPLSEVLQGRSDRQRVAFLVAAVFFNNGVVVLEVNEFFRRHGFSPRDSRSLLKHGACGSTTSGASYTRSLGGPFFFSTTRRKNLSVSGSLGRLFCLDFFAADVSRKLLVATDLVAAVSAKMGLEEGDSLKVVETFKGKDLVGIK